MGNWQTILAIDADKWACATYAANFPGVRVECGSVSDWIDRLPHADVIIGGPPCFAAGTLVTTARGFIPIESVAVGDEVLTHNLRWRKVARTMSRDAATVSVVGQGHHGLATTPGHLFFASKAARVWQNKTRNYRRDFTEPQWIRAEEMLGAFWTSPASYPPLPVPQIELAENEQNGADITPGLMWMVGAWLGNGWANDAQRSNRPDGQIRGDVTICAGYHKAAEMAEKLSQSGLRFAREDQETSVRFTVRACAVCRWLILHFGKYADGKRLPTWALGMPEPLRDALLSGYAFTDGHTDTFGTRFTTVSRELAYGVACLIRACGKSCTVRLQKNKREKCVIEGRIVNEHPYFTITTYDRSRSSVQLHEYRLGRVRRVSLTGKTERVYDIEVEEDHSFCADGIIVHNCQPFSEAGENEGENDERDCIPDFIAAVAHVKPRMFIMENVRGLLNSKHWTYFCRAIDQLDALGYAVQWKLLDSVSFGVPQFRERVWVWGIRSDLANAGMRHAWPMPTHAWPPPQPCMFDAALLPGVTVRQAMGLDGWYDAQNDRIHGGDEPCGTIQSSAQAKGGAAGHYAIKYDHGVTDPDLPSPTIKAGGNHDASGKQGGGCPPALAYRWSDAMLQKHPPASPDEPCPTVQAKWFKGGAEGLLAVDTKQHRTLRAISEPSPTLGIDSRHVLKSGGRLVRRLTPQECLRIQSGPDCFKWPDGISKTNRYRVVGNGWSSMMGLVFSRAFASVDPESKTVIDLFCGGGLGAVGWHGRAWEYQAREAVSA